MSDLSLKEYLIVRGLTPRQAEIAEQVGLAKASKSIGDALFITEKTVKFHLTAIYKKLGFNRATSRAPRLELMKMCVEHKFLDQHKEQLEIEKVKLDQERQEKIALAEKLLKVTLSPGSVK